MSSSSAQADHLEAYLATATYSPGGDGSLIETEDNQAASESLDTAMLGKLSGDALALFKNTGSTYTKQGFRKLAALKLLFADESLSALSLKMFDFFKGCEQGDLSPVAYEAKLRDSFEHFSKAEVPLPVIVQVMFM